MSIDEHLKAHCPGGLMQRNVWRWHKKALLLY